MTDTPPEIERLMRERIMARSGAERFVMGAQMFEAARVMICASFPPGLTESERKRRLFERLYGDLPGLGNLPPRFGSLNLERPVANFQT